MANQDRVNFIWAESALTTIPPIPVSEVAYRDTTQTPEQMEVGQQYDTIYNSARHNQLLFLLTSVTKTLCENGIMPFLAGQEYSQYARCIFTDGKLYKASRAILANEQPYPTPGDDSGVWIAEETSENLVPNSRRVIAGTGLTGGGPLSSDVTLSAKLDGKTTTEADGAITVKDVAIGGDLGDLASARGQIGNLHPIRIADLNTLLESGVYRVKWADDNNPGLNTPPGTATNGIVYVASCTNAVGKITECRQIVYRLGTPGSNDWNIFTREMMEGGTWSPWRWILTDASLGDGLRFSGGKLSVPEYVGATASTAGTSGLVPPAAAGQQNHLLTGGGAYISKVPNATHADTAANATHADTADNSSALAGRPWLESLYNDSAGWLIGSVDEKLRPINTGSLKVLAADRIISGSFAYGRASDGFYLPNGGSWFVFCILDNDVSHDSVNAIPIMAAGGSHITWSFNGTGYTWIGIKVL